MVHYSTLQYVRYIWVHPDQNMHMDQKSVSGSGLQQNRPINGIYGQMRPNNGTLQYIRYIWVHPDRNLHLDQKSGSGLQLNMPNNGILG